MMALSFAGPSFASDPLRLNESFRLLELTSYMRAVEGGGHVFAVQNGGTEELSLILHHLPQNDLAIALNLQPTAPPLLRLFSSDDREFAGQAGASEKLQFTVPAGQVQSFFLPPLDAVDSAPQLYLWTPDALSAYESSRQTFHSTVLLLLSLLFLLAIGVAVVRRSRRAAYALVMAGGLMVLLSSLWMRDVLPSGRKFTISARQPPRRHSHCVGHWRIDECAGASQSGGQTNHQPQLLDAGDYLQRCRFAGFCDILDMADLCARFCRFAVG